MTNGIQVVDALLGRGLNPLLKGLSHEAKLGVRSDPNVISAGAQPFQTSIAAWLAVGNAQKAVDFYKAAFGAGELYRLDGDDGSLAVAQLSVGGAVFWVQDDPDASRDRAGSVRMILSVEDPDAVFDQAVAAGAAVVARVYEDHGWRTGRITDPFGHDWEISRQLTSS